MPRRRYKRNTIGEFVRICSLNIENVIPFYMYKSVTTGITICFAETRGPVVSCYFNLATETLNNDGLPYALHRLIFTGSESYPYKDILDRWSKKYQAPISARTLQHRTYYQVRTVHTEELLFLLPVYLDHILYPTLTDSAYLTEIHHINGEGEDAGAIYCKRMSTEITLPYVLEQELMIAFYDTKCGFTSIFRGASGNLRKSTNNKKVKRYHKRFYRPENLTIFIAGQVEHGEVFIALTPLEHKILSKRKSGTFKKPWQAPSIPFKKSKEFTVYYPHTVNNVSVVNLIWQGPSPFNQMYEYHSCSILWKYLLEHRTQLYKTFPYLSIICVRSLTLFQYEHPVSIFCFRLIGEQLTEECVQHMPKKINLIMKWCLIKVLNELRNTDVTTEMLMIKSAIHKYSSDIRNQLENDSHTYVADLLFDHITFGNTNELGEKFNILHNIENLTNEPSSYWANILEKYFITAPAVTLTLISSIEEHNTLMQTERERIAKQIATLSPRGLRKKRRELEQAIQETERPIPDEVLAAVRILNT